MSGPHTTAHTSRAASHGSLTSYILGFGLSLALTVLSFGAVMSGLISHGMILGVITVLAIAQLLVQLFFFLHLGAAPEQRNNTVVFVLTLLIIVTVVSGSLWVMHNADVNMMPKQMTTEHAMARD
jgi:cytochrome o ubiquinol oxidase operon protein cyoD